MTNRCNLLVINRENITLPQAITQYAPLEENNYFTRWFEVHRYFKHYIECYLY